jgi:hypothetical protein
MEHTQPYGAAVDLLSACWAAGMARSSVLIARKSLQQGKVCVPAVQLPGSRNICARPMVHINVAPALVY